MVSSRSVVGSVNTVSASVSHAPDQEYNTVLW